MIYPLFAAAAYTGARRGELLRSERDDWDLGRNLVQIRETKADRSLEFSFRPVSIHPDLARVMRAWFADHPGGRLAFVTDDGEPINERLATRYFRRAVAGSEVWRVLHGWHTFRHSLASVMASAGVDPRFINEMLGHRTGEMERRYRHLCPRRQAQALNGLYRPAAGA